MRIMNSILLSLTVFLLIAASVSVVSANTLCVSSEIREDNYTNIREALEHAHNGDKILVYPGNYTENVVVNLTDICILSASGKAADTIVQAADANESVFYVSADGVKIGGLTIQGSDRAGIELNSSDGHMILSNTITGNLAGILLNFSSKDTIYRNNLEENFVGVGVQASDDSMVAENMLKNNFAATMLYSGAKNCFSKNTLNDNSLGLILYDSEDNEVTGNTIRNSEEGFILASSEYNSFSRNIITDTLTGFTLQESENNDFTENAVHSPETAVMVNSSSDNCFSRNVFTGASEKPLLSESGNEKISETLAETSENPLLNILKGGNSSEIFAENSERLLLHESENESVLESKRSYAGVAVMVDSSERNNFHENTFTNNSVGCILKQTQNNEFADNCLEDGEVGVILFLSKNNLITSNTLTNMEYGFILEASENNEFARNEVDQSEIALRMESGNNNKISENKFINNIAGVLTAECENNEFSENAMSNGMYAMMIFESNNSTISENEFSNNFVGVIAGGANETTFIKNNISINLLNSTPKDSSNCLLYNSYLGDNTTLDRDELFENVLLKQNEFLEEDDLSTNDLLVKKVLLNTNQLFEREEPLGESWNFGVVLESSNNSSLEGNRISDNYCGLLLAETQNSTLSGNWLENNNFGLILYNSSESLVYNNYLNNTNNTAFEIENIVSTIIQDPENNPDCIWNISKTEGLNIVGGPYLGGNFWAKPDGTGFSQTHLDTDKDGICDLQYNITEDGFNIDFLPLSDAPGKEVECEGNDEEKYNSEESSGGSSQQYLPDSSSNTEHSDSSQQKVNAGTEVKFTFREPKNDISRVSFKSSKYSGLVGIRIGTADLNETEGIEETGSKAYRYVEILVGNKAFESSDNIANGNIEFRVTRSWMTENDINPETISLNRLEDKGWKQLETENTGKDGDYYYFRTQTPGFSCFAITGEQYTGKGSSEQKSESSEEILTGEAEDLTGEAAKEQANTEEKEKAPGFGIILSGSGGLLARACFKRR